MMLRSDEAVYLRWISQGRSLTDIASIEQKTVKEIKQALDATTQRLGGVSIVDVVKAARASNFI